jgi:hypothetical protein
MKHRWIVLGLLAVVPLAQAQAQAQAPAPAQKIVDCMRANVPQQLSIKSLELTSYDRTGGARTMKGRMYMAKEASARPGGLISGALYIDLPAELKGAAYLVKETDDYLRDGMFVYLPAVKRVRRITGTFADGALMGTNFSYFDFKQLQNAFSDLAVKEEGKAEVNGRPAHLLAFKVHEGTETRYTGGRLWVDEEACVVVKAEFNEGSKLVKSFITPEGSLRKADGTWYLAEIEMSEPGTGTRTVARVAKLDSKTEIPRRHFDPNAFHLSK